MAVAPLSISRLAAAAPPSTVNIVRWMRSSTSSRPSMVTMALRNPAILRTTGT